MLFNSYIFIFLFLPLCLLGFYLLAIKSHHAAQVFLIFMSLWFYGYFNINYLPIIILSIAFNYIVSRQLMHRRKRALLLMAIALNIAVIFYYKYFNFFKDTINTAFHTHFNRYDILLPLGISFFTFQQISFIVDSYNGETTDYSFTEYALFVCFFPQLIAGPIVLHREIIPQFRNPAVYKKNIENLYHGIALFTLGLSKKVLLADLFAKAVSWAWDGRIDSLRSAEIMIVMLSYTFQIYFDFSAYSDMATGLACMLNIRLPINFNSPYQACSVPEFWKRWHMSLTRFLREYVYYPLGGSRHGKLKSYLNIMFVFLVSGLWHGANWTFILWGVLHGIFSVVTRLISRFYQRLHVAFQWFVTFFFVSCMWLLFRADSVTQWCRLMLRMFKMESMAVDISLLQSLSPPEKPFLFEILFLRPLESKVPFLFSAFLICFSFFICLNTTNNIQRRIVPRTVTSLLLGLLLALSILSVGGISEFIYYNF